MDVFKTLLLDTPDSLNAITGTLQIANGGTGATSAAGARDNLLPDYTGNVGKVLTVNAGATDVEWTTNGAGTVTSVDLTAGTGVSVSGGPITSSGSITVTNTAPDQTVVLTAGTGISVGGSYPSFTVTNSAPSLGGDVVGPASSTDNAVVRFDGTTGKLVQNSGVTISDADLLTTTDLTVNDDTVLGSSNADTVNFNARVASDINPATDDTYDLGIVGHEWRNLNIDGTANIDSLVADTADIDGGTIDGTTIGATTPSTGAFTTLSATGGISAIGTIGALTMASNSTNATTKDAKVVVKHYTNAEEDFLVFYPFSTATLNDIYYGGGSAAQNSATGHYFAASANNTTTSGTVVASITSTGLAVTGALENTVANSGWINTNSGASNKQWRVGGGSSGQFGITEVGVADRLIILAGGNVGIGTASPSMPLEVKGTAANSVANFSNTAGGSQITFTPTTNDQFRIGAGVVAANDFGVVNATRSTTPFVITGGASGGNVGIGTASPASQLHLSSTGQTVLTITGDSDSSGADVGYTGITMNWSGAERWNIGPAGTGTNNLVFRGAGSNLMTVTTGGNVLIGTATAPTIAGVPSGSSVVRAGAGDWTWSVQSTSASSNRGMVVNYSAAAPNDTGNEMLFCYDSGATRFAVRSNGGIANYQANDVNLSDERVKTAIIPVESYLDKMCAIEVVKFKYKDQTHDDYNLGVIAQQVETVAPEFVDADGFDPSRTDEVPLKAIYQTDLSYGILKAVQELAEENKALRARVFALESN